MYWFVDPRDRFFHENREINVCVCMLNANANLWVCTAICLNVLTSICTHKSVNCKFRFVLQVYCWPDPKLPKFLRFPIDLSISASDAVSCFHKQLKWALKRDKLETFWKWPWVSLYGDVFSLDTWKLHRGKFYPALFVSSTVSEHCGRYSAAVTHWFTLPVVLIPLWWGKIFQEQIQIYQFCDITLLKWLILLVFFP